MKITPREGYILVSNHDLEEKKEGMIIIPGEDKKKTYLKVESDGEIYLKGQFVFAQPFKTKMKIEENLFLISEDDIVATFTLTETQNVELPSSLNDWENKVVSKWKEEK